MTRALVVLVLLEVASAAPAAELEVGYGHEILTRGADWREISLVAASRQPGRPGLELAMHGLERFGLREVDLRISASAPVGEHSTIAGEASASPAHQFTPAFTGGTSFHRELGGGFGAFTGIRWCRYDGDSSAASVTIGSVGVERYFGAFRAGWTGYLATLRGDWSASNVLAWDLYYRDRDRVGVAFAAGREIESTVGSDPVVSRVLAVGLSGRHSLGGAWAVTYQVGVHRQGDLYTRTGAKLGVRRQF